MLNHLAGINDLEQPSVVTVPDAQQITVPSTFEPSYGSPNSTPSSSAALIGSPPLYNEYTHASPNMPRISLDQWNIPLGTSSRPSINSYSVSSINTNTHPHGCPRCPQKVFRTCDGWKRHMKEHETIWPCLMCEGTRKSGKSSSYTRKANLVKHIVRVHKLPDPDFLADKVRRTRHKRCFSCGFCVTLFASIIEQLNHIDNEHFKHHQHIREWDSNKVIRGLLQQRGMASFLQNTFRISQHDLSTFTWDQPSADSLQVRLEVSEEPVGILVSAAIKQSRDWVSHGGNGGRVPVLGINIQQRHNFDRFPVSQNQTESFPGPYPSRIDAEQTATAAVSQVLQEQNDTAKFWLHDEIFDFETPLTQPAFNPAQAGYLHGPSSLQYQNIAIAQADSRPDGGGKPACQLGSSSGSSVSSAAQGLQDYDELEPMYNSSSTALESWSNTSCIIPSNATPKAFANHLAYPPSSSSRDGSNRNEETSTLSSANQQPILSHGDVSNMSNDAVSYPFDTRAGRQGSQNKLRTHYGIGSGLDFDFLEQAMLDGENTRSERSAKHQK